MKGITVYFSPDEIQFLKMAIAAMLEDLTTMAKKPNVPWTPEARKYLAEMKKAGTDLKIKLAKLGIEVGELPPYIDGDELTFFTKES